MRVMRLQAPASQKLAEDAQYWQIKDEKRAKHAACCCQRGRRVYER